MKFLAGLIFVFLTCLSITTTAQKQLVLLKGEKVKLRLNPGDDFAYRLKGSKSIKHSYVNNIFDTAVLVHKDVVPFHTIDRVYFKQGNFGNVIGGLLVVGGVGYTLIDQINIVLVQGEKANLDEGVLVSSAVMVGVGLPLMLIKKKYQKLGGRYRLMMVSKGSPFYMPDQRRLDFITPGDD